MNSCKQHGGDLFNPKDDFDKINADPLSSRAPPSTAWEHFMNVAFRISIIYPDIGFTSVYIGLNDMENEGVWEYSNGETVSDDLKLSFISGIGKTVL